MKVYEADLYRWEGDISVLKKLKWLLVPRYRIVYLKRKCELHADKKHYIRFLFYRFFYQIHISIYSTEIGRRVKIGEGFIIRHGKTNIDARQFEILTDYIQNKKH